MPRRRDLEPQVWDARCARMLVGPGPAEAGRAPVMSPSRTGRRNFRLATCLRRCPSLAASILASRRDFPLRRQPRFGARRGECPISVNFRLLGSALTAPWSRLPESRVLTTTAVYLGTATRNRGDSRCSSDSLDGSCRQVIRRVESKPIQPRIHRRTTPNTESSPRRMRTSMRPMPDLMPNHLNIQVFSIGGGSSFGA
jgi:hypothetical protein